MGLPHDQAIPALHASAEPLARSRGGTGRSRPGRSRFLLVPEFRRRVYSGRLRRCPSGRSVLALETVSGREEPMARRAAAVLGVLVSIFLGRTASAEEPTVVAIR